MKNPIREKHHRLPSEFYRGYTVVAFTACIRNRLPYFTTQERFTIFEMFLREALMKYQSAAEAYLFMPDHAHLLLRGTAEASDPLAAMKLFKQKTGYWLSQNDSGVRWQKDFYDHILRDDDAVERHLRYILNNPVRAGLANHWKDYPYKGSTIHNLYEWD